MGFATSDAEVIVAIVQAIFQGYYQFISNEFDLPLLGYGRWWLYLSTLFWLGMVLLVFAKVVAILCSIGKQSHNA